MQTTRTLLADTLARIEVDARQWGISRRGALLLALFPILVAGGGALLAVLAVGCTLLPFALSLVALRELSAFAAQLAINLEPVYAIVLAILLLGEQRELGATFYVGVAVILAAVLAHPLLVPAPRAAAERSANGTPAP